LLWLGGLGWVLREMCFSVWREGRGDRGVERGLV
jgi:hypothetical protein